MMEVETAQEEEVIVHVEVCLLPSSSERKEVIKEQTSNLLKTTIIQTATVAVPSKNSRSERVLIDFSPNGILKANVSSISLCLVQQPAQKINYIIHVFRLSEESPTDDDWGMAGNDSTSSEESSPACSIWELPSKSLQGLWESLYFERHELKEELLQYASTVLSLSDCGINRHLITWNGLILLHGPPGSGKTSLAQALAHKLSVRMSDRYSSAELVAVNSHSLFSKWFSESGKLVSKMFQRIKEIAEGGDVFVIVLVDEVESLSAARKNAANGSEPSDAIRVVNALLTQLDSLKHLPNVLTIATSNITEAIDIAFIDRADIKEYIGNPGITARYEIISSSIIELCRVKIISDCNYLDITQQIKPCGNAESDAIGSLSKRIFEIAIKCEGTSGRSLRKLPFLALSFLQSSKKLEQKYLMKDFLDALSSTVTRETHSRQVLTTK